MVSSERSISDLQEYTLFQINKYFCSYQNLIFRSKISGFLLQFFFRPGRHCECFSNIYIYIQIRYWVVLFVCLCVCPCTIETTFPLFNFKTKHIYGIHMSCGSDRDHLARPNIFCFLPPPEAPQFFFFKCAPKAELSRRARETPPKAAVLRVNNKYNIIYSNYKFTIH